MTMTNTTAEQKAKKAARMREYRATHKEEMKRYRNKYYRKNRAKIRAQTKLRYLKNADKLRERSRDYYNKNKEVMNERSNRYRKNHMAQINEWSRKNYYKRQNRPVRHKLYSFYRDFVKAINKVSGNQNKLAIYKIILSLPLTKLQKKLVLLTKRGLSQKEIATQMNVTQGTICKAWNGSQRVSKRIFYGGIYNKFIKLVSKDEEIQGFLQQLNLKWQGSHGKRIKKRKISVDAGGGSVR